MSRTAIAQALKKKGVLVSDGAWGTFLQQKGLQPGECPELWNVTRPDDVFDVAKSYVGAGADMIETNSFGGNRLKLQHYGLAGRAAGTNVFVLGSIGPTGTILMTGDVTEAQLYDAFAEQAVALERGGADAVCIETMSAIDEACLAIKATHELTSLEIICTFTFEKTVDGTFRTMMGVSPTEMAHAVIAAGATIIGPNCGNGIERMIPIVKELRAAAPGTPILVHANAGPPQVVDGRTVFPETPADMAGRARELVAAGAGIVGGCCGTTPTHITALAHALRQPRQ